MRARLIVALDVPCLAEAIDMVTRLGDTVSYYKIGSQLFTRTGAAGVEMLKRRGKDIFLDLKFHDIPNTVAAAAEAATELGVTMFNVHASGGLEMMQAAAKIAARAKPRPVVLGVTVLTSQTSASLRRIGISREVTTQVKFLALLARQAGLDGVVASAQETAMIRRVCGKDFVIVTPGVRPAGTEVGDQKRVMTPSEAVKAGANYLVVGRPILAAPDPAEAARRIANEMRRA